MTGVQTCALPISNGDARNIRDGITSLAYRDGAATPLAYAPGQPVTIEINLWPIEWRFVAGSRLRLDVSSSDFPKFHAHPNRAGPWAQQTDAVLAQQTLMVGAQHVGFIDLPVVAAVETAATPLAQPGGADPGASPEQTGPATH